MVQASDQQLRELLAAMSSISRVLRKRATLGIDHGSLATLWAVYRLDGARLSDLAKELNLDISTVSRQVAHLEREGYILRSEDPDDRRAARLFATGAVGDVFENAFRERADILDAAMADWTSEEVDALHRAITRLADAIGSWRLEDHSRSEAS